MAAFHLVAILWAKHFSELQFAFLQNYESTTYPAGLLWGLNMNMWNWFENYNMLKM